MKLSLRTLRRTGRTWVGKTVALTLCVALTLPPTFGVAAELERHHPKRGGVNTEHSTTVNWIALAKTALAFLPAYVSLALAATPDDPITGDDGAITIAEAKPLLFPPAPLGTGTPYPWQARSLSPTAS